MQHPYVSLFFFNDTATTEIYTLSLHDALPILYPASNQFVARWIPSHERGVANGIIFAGVDIGAGITPPLIDRKSTRLNSSHGYISYAVFCLKKKKNWPRFVRRPDRGRLSAHTL